MTIVPLPCPEEYRNRIMNCRDCALNQLPYDPLKPTQVIGVRFPELLMYVEAPGEQESIEGIPLVGKAGKTVFQPVLQQLQIDLNTIAISNVAKHRPPKNRNPSDDELKACHKHMIDEINFLKPKKILAMGKIPTRSLHMLAELPLPLKSLRGTCKFMQLSHESSLPVFFTHHPAYVIYSGGLKSSIGQEFKEDILKAYKENI